MTSPIPSPAQNKDLGAEKTFFGHPKQLGNLFQIELWERFSYYGMQAILLIYLYYALTDGGLGIDKAVAGGVVGAYSGSIYLATLVGGFVADRVLGAERTLFYSGMVIMLGHVLLALVPGLTGLLLGLLCIAIGSGGVKAPASAMVGALYDNDKYRHLRDAGFSLFYISINIGAFLGPLMTGILQNRLGFHYGFGAAAIGMAFGLFWYSLGRKSLPPSLPVNPLNAQEKKLTVAVAIGIIAVIAGAILSGLLTLVNFKKVLLAVVLMVTCGYFAYLLTHKKMAASEKRHMLAYIPMFVCLCVFWALYAQNYTLLVVYFDESVNRMIGGFEFPIGWQPSMQSLWVIALAGAMSALWRKLGDHAPSTPLKFAVSLLVIGASFLFFLPYIKAGQSMPIIVYMVSLGVLTVAELLLSPISLSFATKVAPAFFKTQMVALNFLAISIGMTLGGILFGDFFDEKAPLGYYCLLIWLAAIAGVVFLLAYPMLKKWLKGIE